MPTTPPIYEKLPIPLAPEIATAVLHFWQRLFALPFDGMQQILSGEEEPFNINTVYLARSAGQLAATCRLTVCRANPALGLLGEVATDEPFRNAGLAHHLCRRARDEFFANGGETIFLATGNPNAARLYTRLGWRFLPNTRIMANTAGGLPHPTIWNPASPAPPLSIHLADPGVRVSMVPLLAAPHPWPILDANAAMQSTRFAEQPSCEGLYESYHSLLQRGGQWFVAQSAPGQALGLASALRQPPEGSHTFRVDGFTHPDHFPAWLPLIQAACDWAKARGARRIEAHILAHDHAKLAAFLDAGFIHEDTPAPLACPFAIFYLTQ